MKNSNQRNGIRTPTVLPDFGRVPPQCTDLEMATLGEFIRDYRELIHYPYLRDIMFYKESHQKIFKALYDLFLDDKSPDLLILTEHLRANKELDLVGGPVYLTALMNNYIAHVENYVQIIVQKYLLRELIRITTEYQSKSFDDSNDPVDLSDEIQTQLLELFDMGGDINCSFSRSLDLAYEKIKLASKGQNIKIIKTGFKKIDNVMAFRGRWICIVAGPEGSGKCFGKDTPILMYDHSIKMIQDIKIGDILMGPDGTKRTVIGRDHGYEKLYKVNQRHGMSYVVNKNHILSVKSIGNYKKNGKLKRTITNCGNLINLPIEEYISKSNYWKYLHKGYKGSSSEFNIDLQIDPYFLGLWLGDGTKACPQITNPTPEIEDYLMSNYKTKDVTGKNKSSNCKSFYISGIKYAFKHYNLLYNKHIPLDYLRNTREVKLQLLAGLLDTDGYRQKSIKHKTKLNSYEITQKNERLANDIVNLCNSLGFYVKKTRKIAHLKSRNYSCPVYKMYISGSKLHEIPCKVSYKKVDEITFNYDPTLSTLNIEDYGFGDYYGIMVDKDELFMLEDYTVVHNTKFVTSMVRGMLENEPDLAVQWFSMEDDRDEVIRSFLAMDLRLTTRELQNIDYQLTETDIANVEKRLKYYKKFKIEFYDQVSSMTSIVARSKRFSERYKKFKKVIVIDNLGLIESDKSGIDRDDDLAAKIKGIADRTGAFIFVVHHFTKEVARKANLEEGYRPRKEFLKGSTRILDYVQMALFVNLVKNYPDLMAEERQTELNFINDESFPFTEANFDEHLWSVNSQRDKDTANITDLRVETLVKLRNMINNGVKNSSGKVLSFADIVRKYREYSNHTDRLNKGREERFTTKKASILSFLVKMMYNETYTSSIKSPRSQYLYGDNANLKHHIESLFIVESVKNRDNDRLDDKLLFRFLVDLGYTTFKEI